VGSKTLFARAAWVDRGPASTAARRNGALWMQHGGTTLMAARWSIECRRSEERDMQQETYDPHKSDTEIRQGNKRQMNLRVLVISGVLIVAAFAVIYLVGYVIQN
jgi:hypothetical protein